MTEDIKCRICGVPTENILLDKQDELPVQFCSDAHLKEYVDGFSQGRTNTTGCDYTNTEVISDNNRGG